MASQERSFAGVASTARAEPGAFTALSARRLLVIGGINLILVGMLVGDIFAVFVLHPNAERIGQALLAATQAVAAGDAAAIGRDFSIIGDALENRGTKVDAHLHMVDFGYLALLLAIVMPYVAWSERAKKRLAVLLLGGATVLPIGVFAIHYVGIVYSPFAAIGWASVIADAAGLVVILACAGFLLGLWRHGRGSHAAAADPLLTDKSWSSRVLLAGGTLLILAGFLHGAWYAARDLYRQEERDVNLLSTMTTAFQRNAYPPSALPVAERAVADYGGLQADRAVKVAAHAHIIEFGLVAMLVAFFQPYVFLSERWRRRWVVILLLGSVTLPVSVLLELRFGLLAGGVADFGGFLVILALTAMLSGMLRYTGKLDAAVESATPRGSAL